jgi:hypothetical protein
LAKNGQEGCKGDGLIFDVLIEDGEELLLKTISCSIIVFLVSAEVGINGLY